MMGAIDHIRRITRAVLDVAQDTQCVIDSVPIEGVQFDLVPSSTGDWAAHGATCGRCITKQQTIYGYRLHLLITVGGTIRDFVLTSANGDEREAARDLLDDTRDLVVIGDKGFIRAPLATQVRERSTMRLLTLPKRNQKQHVTHETRHLINKVRQIIETVNGQLTEQLQIESNHAHSFWGLCARLYTKLTAHTLCIYLNRVLGNHNWLRIKQVAFPS